MPPRNNTTYFLGLFRMCDDDSARRTRLIQNIQLKIEQIFEENRHVHHELTQIHHIQNCIESNLILYNNTLSEKPTTRNRLLEDVPTPELVELYMDMSSYQASIESIKKYLVRVDTVLGGLRQGNYERFIEICHERL